MATATHDTGSEAASIAAVPGLDPEMRAAMNSAISAGGELMRCHVLRILTAQLDRVTASRIAELVMLVKV